MSPYTLGKIFYYFSTYELSTVDRRCVHRRGCTDRHEYLDTLHTLYNQQQLKEKMVTISIKVLVKHSSQYTGIKAYTIILSVLQT